MCVRVCVCVRVCGVCVCVCCVCARVCAVCVCGVCVCLCVCVVYSVCVCTCMCAVCVVCVCAHMHACVWVRVCVCVRVCVWCVPVYECVCIYCTCNSRTLDRTSLSTLYSRDNEDVNVQGWSTKQNSKFPLCKISLVN